MSHEDKKIIYYIQGERSPVEEFIRSLDRRMQQKFFSKVELLKEFWSRLPEPHAKYVGDDLFELWFKGQEGQIRILYFFFHQDYAVLVHGFVKKTQKLPQDEKKLAVKRRKDFLENH